MITHNEVTAGLWLVVSVSSGTVGLLFGRWRPSRRVLDDEHDDGYDCGWDDAMRRVDNDRWMEQNGPQPGAEPTSPYVAGTAEAWPGRRTILLEPGPTIYPSLRALSDDALDGPESHAAASDSTWLYKILLDWENRYPIPLDSPGGRMAEAT